MSWLTKRPILEASPDRMMVGAADEVYPAVAVVAAIQILALTVGLAGDRAVAAVVAATAKEE